MGIYPDEKYERKPAAHDTVLVTRTYNDFSGRVLTEYYQLIATIEVRTNCFCCSCSGGSQEWGMSGVSDPYCRNHGWAGTRPCELHDMPGQPDEEGVMPKSVQWEILSEAQIREQRKRE